MDTKIDSPTFYTSGVCSFSLTLQNFSERQILRSLCPVVFHALTLKLNIQTLLSVVSKLRVSLWSDEKVKTS